MLKLDLPEPPPPPEPVKGKKPAKPVVTPAPVSSPDLALLVKDADPRIRRRAALAIGRVKDAAGIPSSRRFSPTPTSTCARWRRSRSASSATRPRRPR